MAGTITRWAHVAALAALLALPGAALMAAPVSVAVQETGFVLPADSGYGLGNTRLGVTFHAADAVTPWTAILDVGQSFTFRFGGLALSEESNHNATITDAETRHLGLQARLGFGAPLDGEQVLLNGTGTAWPGPLRDPVLETVDYTIHWNDAVLSFGNGGRLALSLSDVSFAANDMAQDQFATVTLLRAPTRTPDNDPGGRPVEEPDLLPLALLGLGAVGLVGWWHRRAAGRACMQLPLPAQARAEDHFPRIPRIYRRATAG